MHVHPGGMHVRMPNRARKARIQTVGSSMSTESQQAGFDSDSRAMVHIREGRAYSEANWSVSVWPTIVSGNLKIGAKFLLPSLPPILVSPSSDLACLFRIRGLNFYRVLDAEDYGSRYSAVDHISIFMGLHGLILCICTFLPRNRITANFGQ